MTPRRSAVLTDVALLGLLVLAAATAAASRPAAAPGVLLAACLVPGGAIMTRLRTGSGLTDLALALVFSLAVDAAGSFLLSWSHLWHPEALGIALGVGSAALLLADLLRGAES